VNSTAGEPFMSIGQVVNIGHDLKSELERIARQDFNADATWLAPKDPPRMDRGARARVDNMPRYHRGTHEAGIPHLSVTPDPRNHADSALT
jgi:hypothetical protein